jgi:hypothetical protein
MARDIRPRISEKLYRELEDFWYIRFDDTFSLNKALEELISLHDAIADSVDRNALKIRDNDVNRVYELENMYMTINKIYNILFDYAIDIVSKSYEPPYSKEIGESVRGVLAGILNALEMAFQVETDRIEKEGDEIGRAIARAYINEHVDIMRNLAILMALTDRNKSSPTLLSDLMHGMFDEINDAIIDGYQFSLMNMFKVGDSLNTLASLILDIELVFFGYAKGTDAFAEEKEVE